MFAVIYNKKSFINIMGATGRKGTIWWLHVNGLERKRLGLQVISKRA